MLAVSITRSVHTQSVGPTGRFQVPPAKRASTGRPLLLVLLLLVVLYGLMALGGRYSPALGLDLRGGTTVTLEPKSTTGVKVTNGDLNTAKNILANRVNSLGVSSAEV